MNADDHNSCVFENTQNGPLSVDYVLSPDDGMTWGNRGNVYTAANGMEAGSPQVVTVGGTVVASFMTNEDGGSSSGVDGGDMQTVGSTNGGTAWSGPTVVSPVGSHWGGMLAESDTTFFTLVAQDGPGLVSELWSV